MNKAEVLKSLNEVFIDILDNDDIVLSENSTANDVEEWDSLTHIQLVVAIEKRFKIRFDSAEIQKWKNIGELCDSIIAKLG